MKTSMLKRLKADIERRQLLEPGQRVVMAVSGGPDSMAMLHLLVELNRTDKLKWHVHVAHFNHQIRGSDADADADFVAAQAKALRLPFTIEREDIPSLAQQAKQSIEETARDRRYAFLERACLRAEAQAVAVAHHADDNAETVLHHILRGTGLRGLAGMPVMRPISPGSEVRLIRPLLAFHRAELLAYLEAEKIPYRQDRSNVSDEHTRNRLRNRVFPLLRREFNPQVTDALLRLAEQAQWCEEYLEATAGRTFETLIVNQSDRELVLNVDALLKRSPIIQTELIRRAIATLWARSSCRGERLDRETGSLSFGHLRDVVRLAAARESGRRLSLPGDMTVVRQYRRLVFSLTTSRPRAEAAADVTVACPGRTVLSFRGLEINTEILGFNYADWPEIRKVKPSGQEWFDFGAVRPPLILRSPRPGERFRPLGAPGSKKLSDYFVDAKVPREQRDRALVLCDQSGPLWVIGHRIDERARIRRQTERALKVGVKPL